MNLPRLLGGKPADPIALEHLDRAMRQISPGEYAARIDAGGVDYAAVLEVADRVAAGMTDAHADLGIRRRQRLHEYGRALFVAGFVLALEARKETR